MLLPKDEAHMTLEEAQSIWQKALDNHLFVLCQTTMAVSITNRTLVGYTKAPVNTVYLTKLIERMQDKKRLANKLANPETWGKEGEHLKFDAVVGNPPYQEMDGGNGASASPVYQHFIDTARQLSPSYISMITPSRWFTGGKGLDDFRDSMLTDQRISHLVDYVDNTMLFSNVAIAGGVSYFLWDRTHTGQCTFTSVRGDTRSTVERSLNEYNILIRNNESIELLHRIEASTDAKMDTVVYSSGL